ncbi:hypothetical protein NC661_06380 [Aquibacillus koreensis]|uniref:Uncharacterized protein n=1 Tax=Aquibacillus koreensis TaxID=279446 RepID=A0A9X4AJ17_9BACI|nr:hypothetical protein [Aquibacillus koreensis]MCT2535720.1 hypothetical protein [Aquibacillus koreensis]MDC3419995.1 hypothetical protein [Aquibacillus koreensis]
MINMDQLDPTSLATLSAIVAAVVAVTGDAFNLPKKYRSLIAIGLAIVFVFLPSWILTKVLTACIIGVTASGVYSQIKPSKLISKLTNNKTSPIAKQGKNRAQPDKLIGKLTNNKAPREAKQAKNQAQPDNQKNYHNATVTPSNQSDKKQN